MAKEQKKEDIYYELMPHKKIKNIKKEIENLKKKAEKESFTSKNFMGSVNNLTQSIDSLMELFKEATESMHLEEQAEEEVSKKIAPLLARMDDLEDQNRKIAQGIVTIADMVAELKEEIAKIKIPEAPKPVLIPKPKFVVPKHHPKPMSRPMPPPAQMPPPPWQKPGIPQPGMMPPPMPPGPTPPEPLPEVTAPEKKKGLLGGLFKK